MKYKDVSEIDTRINPHSETYEMMNKGYQNGPSNWNSHGNGQNNSSFSGHDSHNNDYGNSNGYG